jgi:hypothetical protein
MWSLTNHTPLPQLAPYGTAASERSERGTNRGRVRWRRTHLMRARRRKRTARSRSDSRRCVRSSRATLPSAAHGAAPARCGLPLPNMMDKGLLTLIQRARLEQPGGQRQLEDTACCLRSSAAHVRQSLQLFVTGCCNGLLLIGSGRLRKLSPSQSSRIASYCPSLACPGLSTKVHEA